MTIPEDTPQRETCGSIVLMLVTSVAIVIVAAGDAAWQRVKRLWKRGKA